MSVPNYPAVGTAPSPAPTSTDPASFDARADAFHSFFPNWLNVLFPAVLQWIKDRANGVLDAANAAASSAQAATASAAQAATSATTAATIAGADRWVSGQVYAQGDAVWSPLTLLTYRKKTAGSSSGSTDPSADTVNWGVVGGGDVSLAGTQTLTNKTLTTPVITQNVQVISTSTTAVASRTYVLTASLTLTLPASPSAGDWVAFSNRSGTLTSVIARNGSNIMGLAENMTVDSLTAGFTLTFADATRGWVLAP
jgi:hypothetical protein